MENENEKYQPFFVVVVVIVVIVVSSAVRLNRTSKARNIKKVFLFRVGVMEIKNTKKLMGITNKKPTPLLLRLVIKRFLFFLFLQRENKN